MEGIRQYILSLTAASILCAIVLRLCGGKTVAPLIKIIVGIFLIFVAAAPLVELDLNKLPAISELYALEAEEAVAMGENIAREATVGIIKERTEAYILDKAEAMDVLLQVEVSIDDRGIPIAVCIRGNVSPGVKSNLQAMITQDLGISREDQQWSE